MTHLYNAYSFLFFAISYFMVSYLLYWYRHYELAIFKRIFHVNELKNELKQKNEELKKIATTDKLTGLFNRAKLDEVFEKELKKVKRYETDLSIILLDIDHFKEVNDTYGHQTGDIVLCEFAKLLKDNIRESDYLGRWGGEEFLIICPSTNEENIISLATNLKTKIEKNIFTTVNNKTSSFGVSTYKDEDTKDSLIKKAYDALYEAKKAGRNQIKQG